MTALETVLETFLCDDLSALIQTRVGYPILATTFAGIELCGALLDTRKFDPDFGHEYFRNYWSQHLYPGPKATDQAKAIHRLARHGVAHQFFVKGEIAVTSGSRDRHLTYDGTSLIIDTHRLVTDFISSYQNVVRPKLQSTGTRSALEAQFRLIILAGKKDSAKENLSKVFPPSPASSATPGAQAGQTGPI